jgi:6-pyruvoyltetrahydropterin/6-carboxytetrahydropterin synthase
MVIGKEYSFEAAHTISGHATCGKLHGHSYTVLVEVSSKHLDPMDMVIDYHVLDAIVKPVIEALDHTYLNENYLQPTAENLVIRIMTQLETEITAIGPRIQLHAITVRETAKTFARMEVL